MEQSRDLVDREQSSLTRRVAAAIRSRRIQAGWSARQLAEMCEQAGSPSLTRSTIAKIESNRRPFVTVDELDTLAKVFGIPVETLVHREDVAAAEPSEAAMDIGPTKGSLAEPSEAAMDIGPAKGTSTDRVWEGVFDAGTPQRFQDFPRSGSLRGTVVVSGGRQPAPLVGRQAERMLLTRCLESATQGKPVICFVEGDAGVGKTRLVDWFRTTVGNALVLRGHCIELSGAAIPYGALIEALRLFVRHEGVDRMRGRLGPAWTTLAGLIEDFTGPIRQTAAPDSKLRVLASVLMLADHVGRRAPLVVIFEDLHWADPATLDLIKYIAQAKTDQKLMVLCTFRSTPARHPLRLLLGEPDLLRRVEALRLQPFRRPELDEFVASLVGRDLPEDRLRRYFELSEGNAYFAEQLVIADDLQNPDVEVPQSLRALMMVRLGQLSADSAAIAAVAAVAGRTISESLLAAVSDLTYSALENALTECLSMRILVQDADRYAFEHALLRDTAYQAIAMVTRKRLHARIAEALATQPGAASRLTPDLAYHWLEAGRMSEAFSAGIHAAALAVQRRAFPEAQALYAQALRLWPDVEHADALAAGTRASILGWAADAAQWAGHVKQALEWVREAIAEVDAGASPVLAGELRERLGRYLWDAGRPEESLAIYLEAEHLQAGQPPSAVASRVQAALATASVLLGDTAKGLKQAQLAVDLARSVGARAEEGRALNGMGLALTFAGHHDDGVAALRTALTIAEEVDHVEDLFRAYGNLAVVLEQRGRLHEVVEVTARGLAMAGELGLLHTRQSVILANNAAVALMLLGRYVEAGDLLDRMMLNHPPAQTTYARLTRAEIHLAQGDIDAAEVLLEETQSLHNADPRFVGSKFICMAEMAASQERWDDVRRIVDQGIAEIADRRSARVILRLYAVGLRAAADRRDADWAQTLLERVEEVATHDGDETALLRDQCRAERARAAGEDTANQWAAIVQGWTALDQPLRIANAQRWHAVAAVREGDRETANAVMREAFATAGQIGARLLHQHIGTQGRNLRLRLGEPRPFDLTPMERTVLMQLEAGQNNRQISVALSISVNTVGVHVSRILHKLGAHSRAEAINVARRAGIVTG